MTQDAALISLADALSAARRTADAAADVFAAETAEYQKHYDEWTARRDIRDAADREVAVAKAALDAVLAER